MIFGFLLLALLPFGAIFIVAVFVVWWKEILALVVIVVLVVAAKDFVEGIPGSLAQQRDDHEAAPNVHTGPYTYHVQDGFLAIDTTVTNTSRFGADMVYMQCRHYISRAQDSDFILPTGASRHMRFVFDDWGTTPQMSNCKINFEAE